MIAAATIQSSTWGYVPQVSNTTAKTNFPVALVPDISSYYDPTSSGPTQPNQGVWSTPTLAPNGLIYCLPICVSLNSALGSDPNYFIDFIAVGKPGKPSEKTKWYFIRDGVTDRPAIPMPTSPAAGTIRFGSGGTLAPNGLIYFFSKQGISNVLTLDPKTPGLTTSSTATGNVSGATLTLNSVSSNLFGIGQTITYTDSITSTTVTRTIIAFGTGRGTTGTYILNSAVPNTLTGITINGGEFVNCTWSITDYTTIGNNITPALNATQKGYINPRSFRGGILGRDGYIYLIPNGVMLMRMAPKNTSVNNTSTDIYQVHGYYNGTNTTTNAFKSGNGLTTGANLMYWAPKDQNGILLSKISPQPGANRDGGTGASEIYTGDIETGILHPNGKIYLFGKSLWIFVLDPSRWDLANSTVIYSKNSLALPSTIYNTNFQSIKFPVLEKPKSEYIAKVTEVTNDIVSPTVTITVTDSSYIFVGMTLSVYSGSGSFSNPGVTIVDSVNTANGTFVARNTNGQHVLSTNFSINDQIRITPTQTMINDVGIYFTPTSIIGQSTGTLSHTVFRINPDDTIIPFGPTESLTTAPGSGLSYMSSSVGLANGMILMQSRVNFATWKILGTGSNYPEINNTSSNIFYDDGFQTNRKFTLSLSINYYARSSGNFSKIGSGVNGIGQSIGKIIFPSYAVAGSGNYVGEYISPKGYTAFARFFNYAPSDKEVFEPPVDIYNNLATSLYNCYVNKPS